MKKHPSHLWRPGQAPPILRAHSSAKHRALDGYLKRYVAAYTQNPNVPHLTLTVVEGFAGGNVYRDEATGIQRHGSPGVILDALRDAVRQVQARRTNGFRFNDHYIFIEKDWGAYEHLSRTLRESDHGPRVGKEIELIKGGFEENLPGVLEVIRNRRGGGRALFILDQCGYKDVPFQLISQILGTCRNAEVILTFAVGFLTDYLGAESNTEELQRSTGIDFESLKSVDKTDTQWRFLMEKILSADLTKKTGAPFFTPFFIHSMDSRKDLWLVHLSKHVKARDEMGEMHWDLQTAAAHYGRPGTRMLGFHPSMVDLEEVARLPGFGFDEMAHRDSLEALCEELPQRLRDEFGLINFVGLFSRLANETPATRRIFREALQLLHSRGEVLIKDETGLIVRQAKVQHDTDVLVVPTHKTILFPWGHP